MLPGEQLLRRQQDPLRSGWRRGAADQAPQSIPKGTLVRDYLIYKARPLGGAWASNYLRNGSVPNLYLLLCRNQIGRPRSTSAARN
jgi:hypothetical protein